MQQNRQTNAKAIASLVLSCASMICCMQWSISLVMAVLGIVFGILGLRDDNPNQEDAAIAGIVVGEYAVSSGWFCPEAMLYMAVVTVATYSQASFEMGYALKFVRIVSLILTAFFDLWGFAAGIVIWILMLAFNNTISGKSYLYPLVPFRWKRLKRKLFRLRLPHENG